MVPTTSKEFDEEEDTVKPNEAKGSCFTSVILFLFGSEDCLKVQVMELG